MFSQKWVCINTYGRRICNMAKFGLMTDTEIVAANNFNMAEDANVDAMAWSWSIAAKIALGIAGAFL